MKALLRIALLAALLLPRAFALTDNEALNAIAGTSGYTNNGALNFIAAGSSGAVTTIASSGTVDLGGSDTVNVSITGTTTITSFGTANEGVYRSGVFTGILTLTYNGTSMILPNGTSNITTAAGDTFGALSLGSGNWRVLWYQLKSGSGGGGGGGDVEEASNNNFTGVNTFSGSFIRTPATITISEASPDTGTIDVTKGYSQATIDEATTLTPSAAGTSEFLTLDITNSGGSAYVVTIDTASDITATCAAGLVTTLVLRSNGSGLVLIGGSPSITDASSATVATADEVAIWDASAGVPAKATAGAIAALNNPMTTGGDVVYGGASGVPTRLANGSSGQVLTSNGGTSAPSWTTVSGGSGTDIFDETIWEINETWAGQSGVYGWRNGVGSGGSNSFSAFDNYFSSLNRTNTTSGGFAAYFLASGGTGNIYSMSASAVWEYRAWFRFTSVTNELVIVGFADISPTGVSEPTNGVYLRFLTGTDTNMRLVARSASSSTLGSDNLGAPAANTTYELRVWCTGDGTIHATVNGGSESTVTTGIPSTRCAPLLFIGNSAAEDKQLYCLRFAARFSGLTLP